MILTFLSLEDDDEADRQLLKHDERYHRINDDAFHVLEQHSISNAIMPDVCPPERTVDLPPVPTEEELPNDVRESAVKLMSKLCGD